MLDFDAFYKNTFKRLHGFFYNLGVNGSSIEDLMHESYCILYGKYSDSKKETDELEKILFGIARNVYRNWVKTQVKLTSMTGLENLYPDEEILSFENFQDDDFDEELENKKKLIRDALEDLSPKVRQVLELRFFENLSRKEVAERLNMKEDDVHTYQKRGIKYLNKAINSD